MVFNGTDWTIVSTGAASVVVMLAAGYKWIVKEAKAHPQLAEDVEKKLPHGVVEAVEDAGKFVEHIAASPIFAGVAAKGKLQSQHVLGELANSEAAKVAAQVLQAFGKGYSALDANEQNAAVIMARTELSKLGLNITDAQIEGALKGAESAVSALQGLTIFKAIQDLKSVNTAPTEEVPAQA